MRSLGRLHWLCAALLVSALLAAAPSSVAEEPDAKPKRSSSEPNADEPTWYAQALTRGEAGLNVTHFWSKGARLRAETVVAGHKVVTIVNGKWYYAYDGLNLEGMAIERDPKAIALDRPDRRPFGDEYEVLLDQGAELIREEELVGRKAGIYRVTDRHGRRELWVTMDEAHVPLRMEIYDRRTAGRRYVDYVNWQASLPIPDDFFEPDAGIALERISFDEYLARTLRVGPVGPVPVLYSKLLHLKRSE